MGGVLHKTRGLLHTAKEHSSDMGRNHLADIWAIFESLMNDFADLKEDVRNLQGKKEVHRHEWPSKKYFDIECISVLHYPVSDDVWLEFHVSGQPSHSVRLSKHERHGFDEIIKSIRGKACAR